MAISSIGNQGHAQVSGVQRATAADSSQGKQQASNAKPSEAFSVNISTEARNKAQAAAAQKHNVKAAHKTHKQ